MRVEEEKNVSQSLVRKLMYLFAVCHYVTAVISAGAAKYVCTSLLFSSHNLSY